MKLIKFVCVFGIFFSSLINKKAFCSSIRQYRVTWKKTQSHQYYDYYTDFLRGCGNHKRNIPLAYGSYKGDWSSAPNVFCFSVGLSWHWNTEHYLSWMSVAIAIIKVKVNREIRVLMLFFSTSDKFHQYRIL